MTKILFGKHLPQPTPKKTTKQTFFGSNKKSSPWPQMVKSGDSTCLPELQGSKRSPPGGDATQNPAFPSPTLSMPSSSPVRSAYLCMAWSLIGDEGKFEENVGFLVRLILQDFEIYGKKGRFTTYMFKQYCVWYISRCIYHIQMIHIWNTHLHYEQVNMSYIRRTMIYRYILTYMDGWW